MSELSLRCAIELYDAGHLDEAERLCVAAIQSQAVSNQACWHNILGMIAFRKGNNDSAASLLMEAVSLDPNVADYHLNLGNVLGCQEQFNAAIQCFEKALRIEPDCHEAYNGIGVTLTTTGRLEEAAAAFQKAISINLQYAEAHNHLGTVMQAQGRVEEAIECMRQACLIESNYVEAHFNLGMALLLTGDFARGMPEYEWRRKKGARAVTASQQPLWDGSDLTGKRILLYCEEGIGDMFQFIRYAAILDSQGAKVVVECPPRLMSLMSTAVGVHTCVPQGSLLPPHDWQMPLMSLPLQYKTNLQSIPNSTPYFKIDRALINNWRARLADIKGYRIGVCWEGSNDSVFLGRHFNPKLLAIPAKVPSARLINLQKGAGAAHAAELAAAVPLIEFPDLDCRPNAAFVDTAAVIHNIDLVITCDTSIAHLAGALGAKVWVVLPYAPDWRWLLNRRDCPWYPTMRLFRQPARGEWNAVFEQIASELEAVIERP